MKLSRLYLYIIAGVILIATSDLVYIYANEPYRFGKMFLFFALRGVQKGNLDDAMRNLDMGAPRVTDFKIESNIANLNEETRKEFIKYLKQNLAYAFEKNTPGLFSNIYYNLGLITYKNNYHQEANSFFTISVFLDPDLSFLHEELANSYFNDGMFRKGMETMRYCLQFKIAKKNCQEYLNQHVKTNSFLPVGAMKELIDKYQRPKVTNE